MKSSLALLILVLACVPLSAAERPPRLGDDGVSLRLTLTITESDGEIRELRALTLEDQRTRLTSGWRIPTAGLHTEEPGGEQRVSSIQYQNVGLGATLRGRIVNPGRIRADGEVELSSIVSSESQRALGPGAPVVSTFRHIFDVVLDDGAATTLADVPDLEGGSVTLSITAEIDQ